MEQQQNTDSRLKPFRRNVDFFLRAFCLLSGFFVGGVSEACLRISRRRAIDPDGSERCFYFSKKIERAECCEVNQRGW